MENIANMLHCIAPQIISVVYSDKGHLIFVHNLFLVIIEKTIGAYVICVLPINLLAS